jgi:hypothetical protein
MRWWLLKQIAASLGLTPIANVYPLIPTEPDAVLLVRTDRPTVCMALTSVLAAAMQHDGYKLADTPVETRIH